MSFHNCTEVATLSRSWVEYLEMIFDGSLSVVTIVGNVLLAVLLSRTALVAVGEQSLA